MRSIHVPALTLLAGASLFAFPGAAIGDPKKPEPAEPAPVAAPLDFTSEEAAHTRARELEAALQRRSLLKGQERPKAVWDAGTVKQLATWVASDSTPVAALDRQLLQQDLERPVGLIVSGGVSLGAYQAGFMFYYTQFLVALRSFVEEKKLRERGLRLDDPIGPSLVTGASAGSINAFLAAVESCREAQQDPRNSLFYQTWIPIGLEQLMSETDVEPGALLSRKPINEAVARLASLWRSDSGWTRTSCRSLVGISVTRLAPRRLNVLDAGKLWVSKQSEKFMLKLEKKPGAGPPVLTPFGPTVDETEIVRRLYPRAGTNGTLGVDAVAEILKASSSFPLAFSPIQLGYELFEGLTGQGQAFKQVLDEFIDGGVFDNTPIRLAARMQRWASGGPRSQELAASRLLFLEPDVIGWDPAPAIPAAATPLAGSLPGGVRIKGAAPPAVAKRPVRSVFDTYGTFIPGFIDSAIQAEMIETLQTENEVWRRLEIPRRNMPVASGHFRNFFGFLEEDFRLYDFFSGAVDAWQHLAGSSLAFQLMSAVNTPVPIQSPIFQCLLDWRIERNAGRATRAADLEACRKLKAGMAPDRANNILALVDATARLRAHSMSPRTKDSRSELEVFLTALDDGDYAFKNLTYRGEPATTDNARRAIREKLQVLVERLGANEPTVWSRMGVETVGKAAANVFEYRPPSVLLGLGVMNDKGVELQGGFRVPHLDLPLRLQTTLRLSGFSARILDPIANPGYKTYLYDASASQTLLWERPLVWPAILQIELGGGWQGVWTGRLSTLDRYMWRHGPEALLGVTLFQRLFLDVNFNYYVGEGGACTGRNQCDRVSPEHRFHETPLTSSRWQVGGTFGARLLFN